MKVFLFSFFVAVAYGSSIGPKPCPYSPHSWCSSDAIARECGVFDLCHGLEEAGEAVKIDLYFESLCPGCRAFLTGQLWPTFQSLGKDIINITLVPYGNARQEKDESTGWWKFTCQHGGDECIGNIIESCAIVMYKDIEKYFPFIHCLESSSDPSTNGQRCAKESGLDWNQIDKCSKGSYGNKLEHMMGEMTDALNPKHTYVPWIVVNDQHSESTQTKAMMNLKGLVCSLYKGPVPEACKNP